APLYMLVSCLETKHPPSAVRSICFAMLINTRTKRAHNVPAMNRIRPIGTSRNTARSLARSARGRRRSAIVIGILPKRVTTMDLGLKEKVVLITGGSKGIGFACARAFAIEG